MPELNPDDGFRNHERLVRIENGVPVAFDNTPLRWKTDSGVRPTDEWLKAQSPAFYGFITTPRPAFNPSTEKLVAVPLANLDPNPVDGTVTQVWQVVALDAAELAAVAEAEARAVKRAERQAVVDAAKLDSFVQQFVGYDAVQVQDYVETNVTDLASAKAVIKKLALICLALSKSTLSS